VCYCKIICHFLLVCFKVRTSKVSDKIYKFLLNYSNLFWGPLFIRAQCSKPAVIGTEFVSVWVNALFVFFFRTHDPCGPLTTVTPRHCYLSFTSRTASDCEHPRQSVMSSDHLLVVFHGPISFEFDHSQHHFDCCDQSLLVFHLYRTHRWDDQVEMWRFHSICCDNLE